MNRAALFDADGTLFEGYSIFPFFDALEADASISAADNARQQEVLQEFVAGETEYRDFVVASLRVSADILAGHREKALEETAREMFDGYEYFGYVDPLFDELNDAGVGRVLVTAEPQFIARGLASAKGFETQHSSHFPSDQDGVVVGVVGQTLSSTLKGQIATMFETAYAFGDSDGDIGMLERADQAVAIVPNDALREHAESEGWLIVDDPRKPLNLGL